MSRLLEILRASLNVVGALGIVWASEAAPPVDLTDYEGAQRVVRRQAKPLLDKDLIFTDNISNPEKVIRGLVYFKKDAIGRTHPSDREGKPVMRFRQEYRGRFLQYSTQKNWIAVELLNGSKRAWVPADSVDILDEEYIQNLKGRPPGSRR